jgi:3-oxoacyl-[acyl-carrier protein] reductase
MSSESKVAVVTGGSRGIGRAVVERLVARGFDVHFTYVSNEAAAKALVEHVQASGGKASASRVDARETKACTAMVEKVIAERGRLDVLVNNAGILKDRLLAMMTPDDWEPILETSLNGLFGTTNPAAKQMMRQKSGRVINLTSVSGVVGFPGQTAYCTAKAGLIGFTRALSKELAKWGGSVNAVAPGFTDTDMLAAVPEAQRAGFLARVPMGRFGTADEVANVVTYLAADAPQYLTGQVIVIDGGLT